MCFRQCQRFINVSWLYSYAIFSTIYFQLFCLHSGKGIAVSQHCWIWSNILRNHYRGEYVACLSMDLSKAFDCLPHCLTICKLYAYGVSRQACILIASYLQSRKQRIKLGNSRSEWAELIKGVPQGSILGRLIFNIFLNDIFYFATESDLYNYADDNCVSVSHTEMNIFSRHLQSETRSMVKWFTDNSMRANAGKFQGIILCGG